MSILNDLLDKKLGLTSTATDPAIGTEARDEKSKLSVLLDSYLAKDTPEVTETKLGGVTSTGVTSTPVSAEKMQVSNKAEADLRKKQEYLALSDNERWLHDRAYPTEFLSLLDESDLSPTKPAMQMSPNSWASSGYTSRPRTKGEIFEANLKKLSKGDPLRQKVEKIRTIQQQYQDKLVKDGVIEKPHEYQGLWDEVKWLSGEAGKGAASMSLRGIGAASRQLANVSEGAIWNPENFEAYAQKFRSLSQHESLQPDPAKGISKVGGFVASSIGQALPYMAASTGAFLLTGTPIASFGVGFVVEGDEAYQFALENGASEEQAQMNRLIVGTINGAIESLQVSNIIKFAKSEKAGYRALVKAARQKAWSDVRKIGKDLTYEQLEHVLRESLEEALQETTTMAAEADVTGKLDASEAVKRVGGSALGGGVVGLGFGLGGRGARAAAGKESQLGPQTIKKLYEKAAARQTGPETDVGEQIPPISEAVDTSDLPPVLEQKPTQIPETQEVKTKKPEVETPSKPQTAPIPEPEAGQTPVSQPAQESGAVGARMEPSRKKSGTRKGDKGAFVTAEGKAEVDKAEKAGIIEGMEKDKGVGRKETSPTPERPGETNEKIIQQIEKYKNAMEDWNSDVPAYIGLRFADKDWQIGDTVDTVSRQMGDDRLEYAEYGTKEYEEAETLGGTSSWDLEYLNVAELRNKGDFAFDTIGRKYAYILGSDSGTNGPDINELILDNPVVLEKIDITSYLASFESPAGQAEPGLSYAPTPAPVTTEAKAEGSTPKPSRKKSGTKKDGKKKFDFDINTETGEPNLHNRNFKILKKESGLSKSVYDMTEDEFQHWIDTADRIGMGRAARISAKSDRHNVPKRKQGWFDRILETDAPSEPRSPSEPTTTPGIAQGSESKEKRYYTSVPDEWRAENDLYDWGGKKGLRSRGNRKIGKRKSFAWTNEFERMPVRLKGMKKILDAIRSRTEEVFKIHTRKGEDYYLVPPQVLKEVKAKLGDKAFEQKPKPKRSPKQLINDAINAMKRRKHDDTEIGAFIEGYAEELGLTEADYTDNIKGYIEVFHNDPEADQLRASFQSGMVQEVPTPETEEELTAERETIQSEAEAEAEELGDFLEGLGEQEEGSKLGGSRQDYYADRIMQAFGDGVTSEQAYAIVSIWQANADVQGLTLDEWFDKHIADIIWSVEEELTGKQLYSRAKTRKLSQRNKAAVEFLEDGRAIIHALEGADISSLVHETAHIFRRTLSGNDLRIAEQWAGAKDGKWNVDAEEKFARGFERYLRDGSAPTTKLKSIFQKFKQWLTAIYQSIIGGPLDIKITPEMQNVFDRLLTTDIIERENYGKAKETARTGREPADTKPTRRSGPGGERAGTKGTRSNNIESGETPSLEQLEVAQSKQPIIQSAELIPETSDYDFSDFGIDTEELNQAVSDAEKEALEKLVGPVRDKDLLGREELEGGTSGKQTEFFDREDFLTLEERSRINARDDVEGQDLLFQAAEPLDGNQKKGISLALDSLKRGESFLLADGTGFGKTRQIIAIAAMKQKQSGKPSLIVTQSKQIINGNFRPQAQAINVDLSTIEIGTYDGLRSGKIGKKEYGVALFDEAHNLKNLHAGKTIAANKVKTDGKVFATATPMDSPTAASYFLSEISGISQEEVRRRLGYHIETKYNQRGEPYQIAVLNEDNTWITVIDHIVDMRNEAVGRGNMIRREIPFNGTMEDKTVQLASDFRQQQNDIYAYWQKRIKRARSKRAKMNLGGQRTGELSRYTEAMKIAPVFEAAIEDLQAGRKIIIVAEGVNSTEIKALQETVPGFLGDFAKGLEKMGYDYAKIYGPGNKSAEVARFQNDEVQIALMTPKSGGAGIDLDDSIGNNPRTMYIVTTNYSGDIFDQILGRVSRRNTKSPARLVFVKADAISDKKRSNIIDRKVRTLQAIQRGEDLDRAYGFEITDDEGNSQILYQAETEKQTPLDVQNFLRRKKNLAPLRITKDKIDTEALIDGYFAERDEKATEAYVDAMNYQIQIKVALGDKEHSGWRKRHIEADMVIQVYIDLKNNPGQLDKYYDKLTKQQKHIVNQAQNLSGKLKKIADAIIAQNKKHGMEAYRSGVINNVLENYSMRLWVSDTKRNWPNRKFGTQTARAKHRTLEGILHGWSLGKELQIKGATNAQQVMRKQISDTIADRKLLKTGKMYGLISDQKFDDWVRVEHPNFTNWRWAGKAEKAKTYGKNFFVTSANNLMERVPMYAEPDLGKHLNNVLGTSALYKIPGIRWITEWNARLKRWILFTSFFHHQAYLRSYDLGGQTGFANMSPKKAYEAGRTAIENFTPDLRRGVRNGLTIGKIQDYDENALRGKHTLIGRIIRKAKPVDTVVQQAEKLRDWNEHILFSKLGPYLKVQAYLLEYKSLVNKHEKQIKNGTKTLDDLAKIAANLVNDDFGGLHLGRKGRNPTTQHLFRLLALAPDWTESNVASAIKAFKLGAEGSVYRAFWARIAAKGLLAIVVFNYLMAMYDEDDETEETTLDRFVQRYKEAWKSGKMRWLDVDITPIYKMLGGKSDKRKYFSLLGHFKDPIKFIARKTIKDSKSKSTNIPDPLRSLIISTKYKGSVVTRIFADGITGKNWAGREFTTLAELLGVDDKGKYVTTRRGHYRKGDPKGGKLKGELTKWSMGGIKPLGLNQVPSFLIYETENNMPIQVQQGINYLGGQVDAFDAILKSLGVYVHSSYPEKKGKSK